MFFVDLEKWKISDLSYSITRPNWLKKNEIMILSHPVFQPYPFQPIDNLLLLFALFNLFQCKSHLFILP